MIYNIYKIVCKTNKKEYYGRSQEIEKRFRSHKNMLRKNEHNNYYLQKDWIEYGEEDFEFVIIHEFNNLEESIRQEQMYINDNIGVGYNVGSATNGGDVMTHNPRKEETRALKQKVFSGEGNPMYGREKTQKMIDSVKEANSKKVSIEGVVYNSMTEAAKEYDLKLTTMSHRLKAKTERFKNWFYISE